MPTSQEPIREKPDSLLAAQSKLLLAGIFALLLAACSGGGGSDAGKSAGTGDDAGFDQTGLPTSEPVTSNEPDSPTDPIDAARLLQQASFGPSPALISEVSAKGARKFLIEQFAEPAARYTYTLAANRYRDQIHSDARTDFCAQFSGNGFNNCWRDWFSTVPTEWDFFRQAVLGRDQLRQRVAFALSQIFVISGKEVHAGYAVAEYQQMLRDDAFSNLRTILRAVTLSPAMGSYLNMVDNDGEAPNENYARELLQLFALGTCQLNRNGTLSGGSCEATYNNEIVRNYAYALSGWSYPVGGINPYCQACIGGGNPAFFRGEMAAVPARHDGEARALLSGVTAPAGRTPEQGLDAVLDSLMNHQNLAPMFSKQLIQFLVTSNPSPAYIERVAGAFEAGVYSGGSTPIGSGTRGDMKATIAAVLLDAEARSADAATRADFGRLREPVMFATGAIRALEGQTDGYPLSHYQWGKGMGQPAFQAPSVFNYYPPDFPLSGTALVAPQFGIENINTSLSRINFANALIYWWFNGGEGLPPAADVPNAIGTNVKYTRLVALLENAETDSIKVVTALNNLLADGRMPGEQMQTIVTAMDTWTPAHTWLSQGGRASSWQLERVKMATYLMLASPHYQIQR